MTIQRNSSNINKTFIIGDNIVADEIPVVVGQTILDTIPNNDGDGVIWNYMIKSSIGLRVGTITGVWSISTNSIEYYETSTNDIGNTEMVELTVDILDDNIRLLSVVNSGEWIIRIKRTIL